MTKEEYNKLDTADKLRKLNEMFKDPEIMEDNDIKEFFDGVKKS